MSKGEKRLCPLCKKEVGASKSSMDRHRRQYHGTAGTKPGPKAPQDGLTPMARLRHKQAQRVKANQTQPTANQPVVPVPVESSEVEVTEIQSPNQS